MRFADRIRELRGNKGVSVRKCATELGISFGTLSKWESGLAFPGDAVMERLAAFYGVPLVELVAEEAVDRRRIEVPAGVSDDDLRAAVYRLAGQVAPEPRPVDPQSYLCPECGAELRCVARPKD
jgi:transcriptional regulator with XRE-family HTH domain